MKKIAALIFSSVFMLLLACGGGSDERTSSVNQNNSGNVVESEDRSIKVDENLVHYTKVSGVSGNLNSIGSDTLNNLMTFWTEGFKKMYPNIRPQVEGKGSSTAPPALIEGTAQLGPMSRAMKESEIDSFISKYGYEPTAVKVAIDALAVFVHKDNPLEGLSLQQVDAIFSKTLKREGEVIKTWGDLGLSGVWEDLSVSLYGRNSASGTYGFFKKVALKGGDFSSSVKEQAGSSSVVQGIANEQSGIGYSGIGYINSGVRALPLSVEGMDYKDPSYDNCLNGDYPLSRFLYVYINKQPGQPLDTLTAEFLKFVLSKEGQEIVAKDGYYPLTSEAVSEISEELQL